MNTKVDEWYSAVGTFRALPPQLNYITSVSSVVATKSFFLVSIKSNGSNKKSSTITLHERAP